MGPADSKPGAGGRSGAGRAVRLGLVAADALGLDGMAPTLVLPDPCPAGWGALAQRRARGDGARSTAVEMAVVLVLPLDLEALLAEVARLCDPPDAASGVTSSTA